VCFQGIRIEIFVPVVILFDPCFGPTVWIQAETQRFVDRARTEVGRTLCFRESLQCEAGHRGLPMLALFYLKRFLQKRALGLCTSQRQRCNQSRRRIRPARRDKDQHKRQRQRDRIHAERQHIFPQPLIYDRDELQHSEQQIKDPAEHHRRTDCVGRARNRTNMINGPRYFS